MRKKNKIYILGCGGMAREAYWIYKRLGRESLVEAFVEENSQGTDEKIYGIPIMDSSLIDRLSKDVRFIGAIGSGLRKRWIEEIVSKGFLFDTVIDPSAIIGTNVSLESGCIVMPGTIITCDVEIKSHTIINVGATISHDCKIGRFVTVSPGVSIGGKTEIGDRSWIGIGVTIVNNVKVGSHSFIGAGSTITKDIPDNVLVYGVPGKIIRPLTESDWKNLI